MKAKLLRAGLTSISLVAGLGGVAGAAPGFPNVINFTGPDSLNKIQTNLHQSLFLDNDNNVRFNNNNHQGAFSGKAVVADNTQGGGAHSGDVLNANATKLAVGINNSPVAGYLGGGFLNGPVGGASIGTTGPNSLNKISLNASSHVSVHNDNNISVNNNNDQYARSGDAVVAHNTLGGPAVSGNASNTNTTAVDIRVSN